jgi:hypothetical protein
MDLRRYASLLGLWIWAAVGRRNAPFPSLDSPFDHAHDIALAPSVALLSARLEPLVSDDVRRHLESFQGERLLSRSLSEQPRRRASAWLGEGLAIGAESSEVDWHGYAQYHPVTVHWRAPGTPSADVGWLRLRHDGSVRAHAEPGALVLDLPDPLGRPSGDTRFEIFAPGLRAEDLASAIGRNRWRLPGLDVRVTADAEPAQLETNGSIHAVAYAGGPKRFRLEFNLI